MMENDGSFFINYDDYTRVVQPPRAPTLVMLDSNVNDVAVQLKGQAEDVVLIRTISNDKRAFRFVL